MFHGCLLPKAFAATTETVNISTWSQLSCGSKLCENEVLKLHQTSQFSKKTWTIELHKIQGNIGHTVSTKVENLF